MKRIKGLDTLRFILALWVVIGHFGLVPLPVSKETIYGELGVGLYNNMISGPAAVIVFFVISGFCIYYPYRNSDSILLGPYYTRRYIRILTPMIFALAAARLLSLG